MNNSCNHHEKEVEEHTLELSKNILAYINSQKKFFSKEFLRTLGLQCLDVLPEFKTEIFKLISVFPYFTCPHAFSNKLSETLRTITYGAFPSWLAKFFPSLSFSIFSLSLKYLASGVIAGESVNAALPSLLNIHKSGANLTIDLLGEFSLSEERSSSYVSWYINTLSEFSALLPEITEPCISLKLSALYSQISLLNRTKSIEILTERVGHILECARRINARVYFDTEDTPLNPIIYDVFEKLFTESFRDFPLPGIVLQAYRRDSDQTFLRLKKIAENRGTPIAVRLVKGAYWDTEVKRAREFDSEPLVFLSKESTDAQYEKLTRSLLDNIDYFFPAFAGHNIRSLSYAASYAKCCGIGKERFEIQTLYGMADVLSSAFINHGFSVRVYVPVGDTISGMGYLVRRLIENSSNESFLYALNSGVTPWDLKKPSFKD